MTTLAMAGAVRMAVFCTLLGPTLVLGGLLGLGSGSPGGGSDPGIGGLLDTGLLGGGGLGGVLGGVLGGGGGGGGDVLGGVLGGDGGKGGGLLGGVLGGDGGKGGGLLGGVLGGDGGSGRAGTGGVLGGVLGGDGEKGGLLGDVLGDVGGKGGGLLGNVLGDVGDLLNNTTNSMLTGGGLPGGGGLLSGVLDQNSLGNLLGLPGVLNGNLLGLENGKPKEPFQWYDILNLQFIRGSWTILQGTELILNLQGTIVMRLPGPLFQNGVSVDVNITAHLAITQDKPGDLKLVLKNCQDLVAGFTINLPPSPIATLINRVLNSAIQRTLPVVMCPLFQFWINVVNMQLQALDDYALFGLLGRIHSALSSVPISTGQFSELDLKDKPFPGAFLQSLLNYADSNGKPQFP